MNNDMQSFLIERLRKYADIPNAEIKSLMYLLRSKSINNNGFFLKQGDETSSIAFICTGLFRIYCIDISGDEKTLSFRKEGQIIAGYSPFIENSTIWYSIQALEDAHLVFISFDNYKSLIKSHPCWNELIKNYVTELYIEKENRERSLLLESATTRYLKFLQYYPDYEKKISQYHIASYLGITAVSLSRIRSTLKKS